ncbi:MAG: acetoacetate--CoA ligase [Candidatus Krumholzibacteria bacterium]|nr:acetoacetate--CoA ligase [Candidatus Krumholzibacteria bacterium]MDP6668374.1 acetoacetate--CoA ligase [Candidatus Krumholzibacteria bacterium]MDP7022173.1 acetoacetate--CoA ligase [Candidatus Krumholzibacteria bacterium]
MILWKPDPKKTSRLHDFMQKTAHSDYDSLWQWSVDSPEDFWRECWDFCGVVGEPGDRVLEDGDRMPGAKWFPEARLNFAENLLQRNDDDPAVIFRREDGFRREISFRELRSEVAALQFSFREAGLQAGDRVAAFIPNIPEAITAMLAVSSLGGIWSSASPDFGVDGVVDRFGQVEPKFLIVADAYLFKDRVYSTKEKLAGILEGLPTVEKTLVVSYVEQEPDFSAFANTESYEQFRARGEGVGEPDFPRFPFEHPLYILFSSGTTGKPKCMTHGAGGTLLQHLKEHQLHTDVGPGDRLFYFTTTGWMMWNWLVTGLASGATVVLFDGNPFYPGPEALWDFASDERLHFFGTSAKYLDACQKAGVAPARTHKLGDLRAILSTGSPLSPEGFDYVYGSIKEDLQLASISGGTDIVSCFALGCPVLPVHRGELQCRGLGMKVDVLDASGATIRGEAGELVCTAPAPSMPVSFWNDPDGSRYRAAYFERFDDIWCHGDWATLTESNGMVIHGRSDATLNPGGVRIGTAEIYRQVEKLDIIEESIVVGQDADGDQRVVLFVKLREGATLDEDLREKIRKQLRDNATPRHVPRVIAQVSDIPRTRSGKISEIAVRNAVHGRPAQNIEALLNPEALDEYRDRVELKN